MKKKLKIKFWKAERALAMQIVEQEGLPEDKETGNVRITNIPTFYQDKIYLRGDNKLYDSIIDEVYFESNEERDEYLDKITQAITDELFISDGELKLGEMCEVRINKDCPWKTYKMLAILPKEYGKRYIASICDEKFYWMAFGDARPLRKRTKPKVDGNGEIIIYTWEEE